MALKYQRILLKISGEALGGEKGTGFDEPTMDAICGGVKKAHELGVQIGIVVGGGNFWRGRSSGKMERTLADKIGMLATVMNALAVSDKLEQLGVPTEVFTSITMPQVAPAFTRKEALHAMEEGKIAIFGGGTGNPFFSTDTTTALRAVEVSADIMFKGVRIQMQQHLDASVFRRFSVFIRGIIGRIVRNLSNRFVLGTKYLITFSRNGLRILAKKWLQSGLMVSL